ncbi:putative cytochrome P450 monooxygenase [Annulohypoxylon moriforme]|nr:putative cytochrome P450 monooxygenase [Annulohypoxylon moriforme]
MDNWCKPYLSTTCGNTHSNAKEKYLTSKYPITSYDNGRSVSIPSCPYRWPNGQGDIAKFLEGEKNSSAWAKDYGGVYRIWSGTTPEIVISTPEDVKTVFRDSDMHTKAFNNDDGWLMGQLLGKCVGLVSGVEWRQVRASTNDAFTHRSAAANTLRIMDLTKAHFADLHSQGRLDRGVINPAKDLKLLPFGVMADYLYGDLTPGLQAQLRSLIPLRESLFEQVIRGGLPRFAWSRYLPTKTNRDLRKFKSEWAEFNDSAHDLCRSRQRNVPIVQMYESLQAGSVRKDHVLHTLDEMLFGNLDVAIGGISWNLLFLAADQEVQTQLREEVRRARMDSDSGSDSEDSETFLSASILESSRLKPLAAFSIPQAAPTDRVVGGFLIPAGTNFVVDTYALNMRNPSWGNDSGEYKPSRFMGCKATEMRYRYWRFGFGPRQCLGKYVADLIIHTLLAYLVENYQLSLTPTTTWDKDKGIWITQPNTDIQCEKL